MIERERQKQRTKDGQKKKSPLNRLCGTPVPCSQHKAGDLSKRRGPRPSLNHLRRGFHTPGVESWAFREKRAGWVWPIGNPASLQLNHWSEPTPITAGRRHRYLNRATVIERGAGLNSFSLQTFDYDCDDVSKMCLQVLIRGQVERT